MLKIKGVEAVVLLVASGGLAQVPGSQAERLQAGIAAFVGLEHPGWVHEDEVLRICVALHQSLCQKGLIPVPALPNPKQSLQAALEAPVGSTPLLGELLLDLSQATERERLRPPGQAPELEWRAVFWAGFEEEARELREQLAKTCRAAISYRAERAKTGLHVA